MIGRQSTSYEVNYLQPVTVFKGGCFPAGAGNDFKIEFHGDAVRFHAELGYQRSDSEAVRESLLFAVEVEEHA